MLARCGRQISTYSCEVGWRLCFGVKEQSIANSPLSWVNGTCVRLLNPHGSGSPPPMDSLVVRGKSFRIARVVYQFYVASERNYHKFSGL